MTGSGGLSRSLGVTCVGFKSTATDERNECLKTALAYSYTSLCPSATSDSTPLPAVLQFWHCVATLMLMLMFIKNF